MKLSVLGASGGIGRHVVTLALADGHQVTAAVRDPARLAVRHDNLTVVRADALDAVSVKEVIAGSQAVLSGIGAAGRKDPLRPASTSARAALEAMASTGVRRILTVSAGPLNRTGAGQPFASRSVFGPLLWAVLRDVYTDLARMERILRDSDVDWTVVRPPRLLNSPGTGTYRHLVEAGPVGASITRADAARAMLDFVTMPETFRHAVGISA
ncbi:NAD(P)-dependent oxidoreductase [Nonomuraea sediminis]|uniref:NAD(P)-dependent oxidoreductase n=1 Tax=Nonomuraea sediminis TaxID=2835864 RepID=UPI001BDC32E0|nr:SDR family oxidoreductase [Nonomuraea sediminis]